MRKHCFVFALFIFVTFATKAQVAKNEILVYRQAALLPANDANKRNGSTLTKGKYIVFEFTMDNGGDASTDQQSLQKIWWQVKRKTRFFSFSDAALSKHGMEYGQLCRCVDGGWQPVDSGMVKATYLQNGTWQVSLHVFCTGARSGKIYPIEFEGIAKEATRE